MSRRSSSHRCYVDNAYNRDLGRVGQPLGSHVVHNDGSVSRSSSSSWGASSFSSSQRCYVDNSYNRDLGRVGQPLGTHVAHKDGSVTRSSSGVSGASSSRQRCYVDNSYNRELGRVGKPLGTHVAHKDGSVTRSSSGVSGASSSRLRCYVDNSYNRELGRVGKPLGTHVAHKDGSVTRSSSGVTGASSSRQGCYVDNSYNRELGRVGKPLGTHVAHKDGSVTRSSSGASSSSQRCYVDNAYNRELGRVGKPLGTHVVYKDGSVTRSSSGVSSSSQRCYVDNAYNRKLNRVGKPLGAHVVDSNGSVTVSGVAGPGGRCYVNNAHNRALVRVGKPIPRRRVRQMVEENTVQDLIQALEGMGFVDVRRPDYQYALNRLEREQVEERWRRDNIQPSTDVSCCLQNVPGIIPRSELQLEDRVIGRGGFGEVYAGLWRGTPVAFKKLLYQQMSKKHKESFKTEIKVLATINHPNTVKMFGAVIEDGKIGIVMEYLQRSLFQAVFIDETCFSESKKKEIVSQMASALLYLHTHEPKIAHCDIKSENVLLDKNNIAKLGDFGLSALKNTTESSRSTVAGVVPGQGTPRYSAPEVLRGELLTRIDQLFQTDLYSLAIVVFEVVAEEEPFEGLNIRQLEANVGRGDLRPSAAVALAQPVTDLLQRCWDGSAFKRVTVAEFQARWSNISGSLYKS